MNTLTTNAQTLYTFLKATGGAWEGACLEAIFPKANYPTDKTASDYADKLTAYFQYNANRYGGTEKGYGPCEGVVFTCILDKDYSSQTSAAYQELRKAGLAGERNSGFNDYYFFPKK